MPYESPSLEITNFDIRAAGESDNNGQICSPVTAPMPF